MLVELSSLLSGETGLIKQVNGTDDFIYKLQSIGIRIGKKITKVSGQPFKGPQVVKIDNMQIALGVNMAKEIFVEVLKS